MLSHILAWISVFFAGYYLCAILFLHRGLIKLPGPSTRQGRTFTIIIAARNEEKNIGPCLDSVFAQSIDPVRYEVIVVNDRSCDATAAIVEKYCLTHKNLSLITITDTPLGISPKKHAISQGIAAACKEVIVFTDADCSVPSSWLSTIDSFMAPTVGLVQGITTYSYVIGMNRTFFGLQAIDFLSHGIIAAGAIGANMPINSNANNMAFRRQAFVDVGGYAGNDNVTLGDDDLLLQKIWKSKKWKISFMADQKGAVTTLPTMTPGALLTQRSKWGSVTVHYGLRQVAFLAGIFLFYLAIPVSLLAGILAHWIFGVTAGLLIVKILGEMILLLPGTAIFNQKKLRRYIIAGSLIQLPLVLCAVAAGVFGTFEWKGQRMKSVVRK